MNDESYKYSMVVEPAEDGDGFFAFFPDLPGCMGDGESPETAIADARLAFAAWMEVQATRVSELPEPGFAAAEAQAEYGQLLQEIAELTEKLEEANARIAALEAQKGKWVLTRSYEYKRASSIRSWPNSIPA